MDLRAKFEELLKDKAYLDTLAEHLGENVAEEVLTQEEFDAGFDPDHAWVVDYILTKGLDNAVKRLLATGAFDGDQIYVYRGFDCPSGELEDQEIYAQNNLGNVSGTVSYTLSKLVALEFAGPKGVILGGFLDEETIHWNHFLYLHIVYPGCSDRELEIPSLPRRLRDQRIFTRDGYSD